MSVASHRLAAYYQSDDFAVDYPSLARRNPAAAIKQLRAIIDQLNENYAVLGVTLSDEDIDLQARFVTGDMPMPLMLLQVKLYAASIRLRWPEAAGSAGDSMAR